MNIESHFENHKAIIVEEISKAKTIVVIAVAWINFKDYFETFNLLIDKGIQLKIVCSDNWQNRTHLKEIKALIKQGAEIKLLKMPSTRNHMHHKFCVIDNVTIINGSFNWSPNATKSFENLLVIKDLPSEAKKFIAEFNQLVKIETQSLKGLQKKNRCKEKGCKGDLHNILVFSDSHSKYYELSGDVIQLCDSCSSFKAIKECITNSRLVLLLDTYRGVGDDYEEEKLYNLINEELQEYMNDEIIIHALGQVYKGLDGFDNDYLVTNIIWKNKFVGNRVHDKYDDENFGVAYDVTQVL